MKNKVPSNKNKNPMEQPATSLTLLHNRHHALQIAQTLEGS